MTRLAAGILLALILSGAAAEAAEPEAAAVIRHYYNAINHHHYRLAFNDWWGARSGVLPTGQTYRTFKAGFRTTASVSVEVGTPGEPEGAAGSSYIEVPVTVTAQGSGGETRRFAGSYMLRKSNLTAADGVPPDDMHWHLYSATLKKQP